VVFQHSSRDKPPPDEGFMDLTIFVIDPSPKESERNSQGFIRIIDAVLKTEAQEIVLVSMRDPRYEEAFLKQIPVKTFEAKKGLFSKTVRFDLKKRHLQTDRFEPGFLLNSLGKNIGHSALFFFEDEPTDLAFDGKHAIIKLIEMAEQKKTMVFGIKKISFSEVGQHLLVKGSSVSEGEYRLSALFQTGNPLQSPSNLALSNRFILNPSFFKRLDENMNKESKTAFFNTLESLINKEAVYGFLPFKPVKIK
jgi:hypothetical protein